MRSLFLKPPVVETETKEAGFTHRLGESPENWGQEIGSELHRQLPFLSDYEVNVNLDKIDEGRGFAFGYADVSNRTERPEVEHEESGIPHIRIPLIAEERQVRPFTVYLDGERVMPLGEERIRETLFNPGMFDLSNSVPRDPSLVEPLMPPQRSGIGLGGEYKMASIAEASLTTPPPSLTLDYRDQWIQKYVGTSLFPKALELQHQFMALDEADLSQRELEQTIEESSGRASDRMAKNLQREALNLQKRNLDIELIATQSGVQNTPAPSPHEQGLQSPPEKPPAKEKKAFKHISKEQWQAIYASDKVQKLIQKHMTHDHPEVINEVYSIAANQFGYQPKVYPPSPGQQAQSQQAKPQQTKTASLLEAIAPTLRETDRDSFVEKVASDPYIREGFKKSGIARLLVDVMDTKLASASDRLQTLADNIMPSVVTFQKLPGGDFLVKSANVAAFAENELVEGQKVPFEEVAQVVGESTARSIQPGQVATAVSDPINLVESESEHVTPVSEFGKYRVQSTDGSSYEGWVFPQTFSWDKDLAPQNTSLFISDKNHAIQQDVVGEKVDFDEVNIPTDIPKGLGVFRSSDGSVASTPIDIKFGTNGSDGVPRYVGFDSFGNEIKVSIVPGLKAPQAISDSEFAVPHGWAFTKLRSKVPLADKTHSVGNSSKANKEKTSAVLFFNGAFNIEGGCGLDKVSSDLRYSIDAVGAEFMLGLLGVDGVTAKQKVAQARKTGSVKLSGLKTIIPLSERYSDTVKTASSLLSKLPDLRKDLIKEAAEIQDQGTVDKILALNFINPENLETFIEYLPALEECSEKMAEMVLAGYLGMKEIPVGAVERSMKSMEEVIQSLKAIQYSNE